MMPKDTRASGEKLRLRAEEIHAAEVLSEYLTQRGRVVGRYAPGADPPDLLLPIDGTLYGVEVTRLIEQKQVSNARGQLRVLSRRGELEAFRTWLRAVEEEARNLGVLDGDYFFMLRGDFGAFESQQRATAKTAALDLLRSTMQHLTCERQTVWTCGEAAVVTTKHLTGKTRLIGTVVASGWGHEVRTVASAILSQAISLKASKTVRIALPLILVLLNSYPLAEPADYQAVVAGQPESSIPFDLVAYYSMGE